jgi:hypothetical protein
MFTAETTTYNTQILDLLITRHRYKIFTTNTTLTGALTVNGTALATYNLTIATTAITGTLLKSGTPAIFIY